MCDMQWHSEARFRRAAFYRGVAWDKADYHSLRDTNFVVYRYIEGNTDLHKGDELVRDVAIVTFMYDWFCITKNSSTITGVSGDRFHREKARWSLVDSKILMFVLSIHLLAYYILNPIGSLTINILCIYIQSDTKNGKFWKTPQNWRDPRKKFIDKLNHYNLPFKRQ